MMRDACALFGHPSRVIEPRALTSTATNYQIDLVPVGCCCGAVERYVAVMAPAR